jgi:transposase
MAEDVAQLCRVLPIKHVAERCGLDWHTVKAIDKAWLERTLPPLDMTGVDKLIMDEFAIHKGHRYATLITDADTRKVLRVGLGRGKGDQLRQVQLLQVIDLPGQRPHRRGLHE